MSWHVFNYLPRLCVQQYSSTQVQQYTSTAVHSTQYTSTAVHCPAQAEGRHPVRAAGHPRHLRQEEVLSRGDLHRPHEERHEGAFPDSFNNLSVKKLSRIKKKKRVECVMWLISMHWSHICILKLRKFQSHKHLDSMH